MYYIESFGGGGGRGGGGGGRGGGGHRGGGVGGRGYGGGWRGRGLGYGGYGGGYIGSYGGGYNYPWYYPTFLWGGICKDGCGYVGNGQVGCINPGYGTNSCIFASDCTGC